MDSRAVPDRDSIPEPSSPYSVAIPTTLLQPTELNTHIFIFIYKKSQYSVGCGSISDLRKNLPKSNLS